MQSGSDNVAAAAMAASASAQFAKLDDIRSTWLSSRRRSACRPGAPVDEHHDHLQSREETDEEGEWVLAHPVVAAGGSLSLVYLALARTCPSILLAAHVDDVTECVNAFCRRMAKEGLVPHESSLHDAAILLECTAEGGGGGGALEALADTLGVALSVSRQRQGLDRIVATTTSPPLHPCCCIVFQHVGGSFRMRRRHDTLDIVRRDALRSWLVTERRGGLVPHRWAAPDVAAMLKGIPSPTLRWAAERTTLRSSHDSVVAALTACISDVSDLSDVSDVSDQP